MSPERVDIDVLTRDRSTSHVPPPRRRWLAWLVPLVIAVIFLGVISDSVKDAFTDPISVTVVRPRSRTSTAAASGLVT